MERFVTGDVHGNYKALLQCLERSGFNKEKDQLIQLGDVVDGFSEVYECVEELLSIKNLIALKGNHDCLDTKTEVFTKRGWLKYNQLTFEDFVIGINSFGKSDWQKIKNIIIKKSNHLNYYSNNKIDMALTDGHRIMYKENDEFKYKKVRDIRFNDRLSIPLACDTCQITYPILDEEIKLVAWILTDGNINKNGYITIYQSKPKNLEYIKNLLIKLNLKFTHYKRQRKNVKILGKEVKSILEANEFKILAESSHLITKKLIKSKKTIPDWCYKLSSNQLRTFLFEIIRGDGSIYKNTTNAILYGTYEFLSNIQPLFNMAGYSANLKKSNRGDFRLNISIVQTIDIRQDLNIIKRVTGNFNVWCLEVPFTNFLVRRNDKSYFTGNCWFNEYCQYGLHPCMWQQGGLGTLKSYCKYLDKLYYNMDSGGYTTNLLPTDIPKSHRDFFKNQKLHYRDHENRFFVHGGFDRMQYIDYLDIADPVEFYWDRDLWKQAKSCSKDQKLKTAEDFKEIFIGHTATINDSVDEKGMRDFKPVNSGGVYNLDQGAGWFGKLTMMNIDTKEYWQSDITQELYPNEIGR